MPTLLDQIVGFVCAFFGLGAMALGLFLLYVGVLIITGDIHP